MITDAIHNVYTCNIIGKHVNLMLAGLLPKQVTFMLRIQFIQVQHSDILLIKMTFKMLLKFQMYIRPSLEHLRLRAYAVVLFTTEQKNHNIIDNDYQYHFNDIIKKSTMMYSVHLHGLFAICRREDSYGDFLDSPFAFFASER